jgi:CRP-like cAMP-binding protein
MAGPGRTFDQFTFLTPLTDGERDFVAREVVAVSFAAGSLVVREGDGESFALLLTAGTAEVRTTVAGSNILRTVALLGPGDVFGEMALLTGDPRRASVVARTELVGFRLERVTVEALLRKRPALVDAMAEQMAERLITLRQAQSGVGAVREVSTERVRSGLTRRIHRACSLHSPEATERTGRRSSVAHGRLLFHFPRPNGDAVPLHHMRVEVWSRDTAEYLLGTAVTGLDGSFSVHSECAADARTGPAELRVFETHHSFTDRGEVSESIDVVHVATALSSPGTESWDFGEVRVPYWEYAPEAPTPRTYFLEHGDPPQQHPAGRAMVMLRAVGPVERIKQQHLQEFRASGIAPDISRIQSDYPENLTRRLEREQPGVTRGDSWFADRLLNGMTACVFDRVPEHPEQLRVYHHWNSYAQDGVHALPNVDMRFAPYGDTITPVEITMHLREPGATAPHSPTRRVTVHPDDGPLWLQAKRIARTSAALVAELDQHLVSTHLNVEQYAIPAYRNLRRNPLRLLLFPHLRDVAVSNRTADTLLLGPAGFLVRGTALTEHGLVQRVQDVLGTLDWKDWAPQTPVCATHWAAHAGRLYWEVLGEYLEEFFGQHADGIAEHWIEIRRFSDDLVCHSVPAFLCQFLRSTVEGRPPAERAWFTTEERMNLSAPRPTVDGVARAVHPLTQQDTPSRDDWDALKQCCRYIIYHATFRHSWTNQRQYDDGGELRYATLSLRYGPDGIFGSESDDAMLPPATQASELLWISYMLSHAVYGLIMRNEDRDIHPALLEQLERRRAAFAAFGLDVDTIQSRTNI